VHSKFVVDLAVIALLCNVYFENKVDSLDSAGLNSRDKRALVRVAVGTGEVMCHCSI
jgi:hypothetical protein